MNVRLSSRISEYRIDFGYTCKLYYNAHDRIKKQEAKTNMRHNRFNIISIALSVITISAIMLYLGNETGISALYASTFLSLASVIISIYLFAKKQKEEAGHYLQRAEAFRNLHKRAKNIEASAAAGLLTDDLMVKEIENLQKESERLSMAPLPVENIDFELAKAAVKEGQLGYTDEDFFDAWP